MSDDFNRLTRALRETPAPAPNAKARALLAARETFSQETARPARPIQDQHKVGIWKRIAPMFATPSLRPALYITSSLVAVGFGVLLLQTQPPEPGAVTEIALDAGSERVKTTTATPQIAQEVLNPAPAPLARSQRDSFSADMAPAQMMAEAVTISEGRSAPVSRRFANDTPNPLQITAETPVSTFAVDVDTASYVFLRRALLAGSTINADAIRTEELINYFDYTYTAPTGPHPFAVHTNLTTSPWDADKQILRIALQGAEVAERPPLDLVFLIDTSGSMAAPEKLPLLIQSFKLLLPQLTAEDTVSIVTYAGSAGVALEPTAATERREILDTLEGLTSGGGTAGAAGLDAAYRLANAQDGTDRVRRVMLATDGDFNIGLSGDEELEDFIAGQRESGTYLSVLGFGTQAFDDATMQALAQAGNGIAAHIDTLTEARRVLVEQLMSSLVPIADDVKIQVEFNPAAVAEYRLIGYETRALTRVEFNDDRVDAGEVGAGHQVTALYEITPTGSPAQLSDPLRYGAAQTDVDPQDELAFVKLRYKQPGADESVLLEQPVATTAGPADDSFRFAMALARLGDLLREFEALPETDAIQALDAVIALADGARGDDVDGTRREAISLIRTLRDLRQSER